MIAWWGWIAIWGGLVITLLATIGLLLWWLFRKAMTLLDDATALADAGFDDEAELSKPVIAVLAEMRDIRAREAARRSHRRQRRTEKHRRRMSRARTITSAEASQQQWPAAWYSPSKE